MEEEEGEIPHPAPEHYLVDKEENLSMEDITERQAPIIIEKGFIGTEDKDTEKGHATSSEAFKTDDKTGSQLQKEPKDFYDNNLLPEPFVPTYR